MPPRNPWAERLRRDRARRRAQRLLAMRGGSPLRLAAQRLAQILCGFAIHVLARAFTRGGRTWR